MAITPVRDEAHWHELRAANIGGSDVAALLGISPYKSKWQLWMEKTGKLEVADLSTNSAVQAGTFLESGIANWASHRWNMDLSKVTDYYTAEDVAGMGASLDYITQTNKPAEIKWSARGHGWQYDGDKITEAPEYYLIQVQHQIACLNANGIDADSGWLIALIDNEPRRMLVPRHDGVVAAIREAITGFWVSVIASQEPDPDFSLDGDSISRMFGTLPMAEVELDSDAAPLFAKYLDATATEKLAKESKEALKAELLYLGAEKLKGSNQSTDKAIVRCGDHKISISTIAPNFGTEVTQEMVGTHINTRKGYQTVRIS
jgi:putative phage-type endonuclease